MAEDKYWSLSRNSKTELLNGINSLIEWLKAIYSASVVERATSIWILDTQVIVHPQKKITKPILDHPVSSSSYEVFSSSSDSSAEEEEEDKSSNTKSVQGNKDPFQRQKNNDLKDYDEDGELNKIIATIEREHISTMYDNHLNTKNANLMVKN